MGSLTPSKDLARLAAAVRWVGRGSGVCFFLLFLVVAFASGDSSKMMVFSLTSLGLAPLVVAETAAIAWLIGGFAHVMDEGEGSTMIDER